MTAIPPPGGLCARSALQTLQALREGGSSARQQTQALLTRVEQVETAVGAWAHLDPGHVLAQADAADAELRHRTGAECGALHGVAVGLKDIIDTADLPTENGCVLHAGRQPSTDAELVRRLRSAGALVMGKTVTTELATYAPGGTRNPHHLQHTPGGSSSGSAAAVAAGMVPLAVGTQTSGSVIRPASFCGVVGYKPSRGWISRSGVLQQSPSFDQVGLFGRSVPDVALLAQCLVGHDPQDLATRLRAFPQLLALTQQAPPRPPKLAVWRTPHWARMERDAQAAFDGLVDGLAGFTAELEWAGAASQAAAAVDLHRQVMEAEIAAAFDREYRGGSDRLSASLRGQIERGRSTRHGEHWRALQQLSHIAADLDRCFEQGPDAILTPATLGTAPLGLSSTGDPVMCVLWTAAGLPAIALPLLHGENGLPIGVQLVGRRDDDARLLRTAHWLMLQTALSQPAPNARPAGALVNR